MRYLEFILQSLVENSLLRRRADSDGEPRFWMLETIREYAAEQLEESGERSTVEDRLIDAACEFARAAEPEWRLGNTDEWSGRFDLERAVLAELDHESIARMLDGGATAEGIPYLVMEFVDGQPIDRYCDQNRLGITAHGIAHLPDLIRQRATPKPG